MPPAVHLASLPDPRWPEFLDHHPAATVRPSDAAVRLTKSVQETARLRDILVHDHIIVGENRFFSFREEGMM